MRILKFWVRRSISFARNTSQPRVKREYPVSSAIFVFFCLITLIQGSVAQSVEQRTENPRVGGSIPSRATIFFRFGRTTWRISEVAKHGRL
jgi:uncharacterized membrane protein